MSFSQSTRGGAIRLSIVAPSGSGKSTAAKYLYEYFTHLGLKVQVLKLAAPLYRLQARFYSEACTALSPGAQDQKLLEQVAGQLRSIDPFALVKAFAQELEKTEADVVINDDLRDDQTDWPYLRENGFKVIKIVTDPLSRQQRLESRKDISVIHNSALDFQIERIHADFTLANDSTPDAFRHQIQELANHLMSSLPVGLQA
ncbi:dephospho-CoA kinase [Pseudomonas sp. JAI115]|uniref:dephospho-CoA kinase n=1 Tax=Pseudomonas sp. JAI115 TaxID=2723061 RepID=UPI001617A6AB|nr:dephospho-CoA kinase [Pseudomonas sp. JAI115]MBB6157631.1 dephospho-CoA kinase [Pseudomonas sp. JAI115]